MTEWTPEGIRRWLLARLYKLYMQKPRAQETFSKVNDEGQEMDRPPFDPLFREAELLSATGDIKMNGIFRGFVAKMTPNGRISWEVQLKLPSDDETKPIGFDPPSQHPFEPPSQRPKNQESTPSARQ